MQHKLLHIPKSTVWSLSKTNSITEVGMKNSVQETQLLPRNLKIMEHFKEFTSWDLCFQKYNFKVKYRTGRKIIQVNLPLHFISSAKGPSVIQDSGFVSPQHWLAWKYDLNDSCAHDIFSMENESHPGQCTGSTFTWMNEYMFLLKCFLCKNEAKG